MSANLGKVFLEVINVYYEETSADTSNFGHPDKNYKKCISS